MNKYNVGDLVWIPDGTTNYTENLLISLPFKGPACGLVLKAFCAHRQEKKKDWLKIQVKNHIYIIKEKNVRKIEDEETVYG